MTGTMDEPLRFLRRANPVKRLGEGSWVADDCLLGQNVYGTTNRPFWVWVPAGDGHVLRYVDKSYTARVR